METVCTILSLHLQSPLFSGQAKEAPEDKKQNLEKALNILESYVKGDGYIAGTTAPTIADYILLSSVTTVMITGDRLADFSKYPEIAKWTGRVKATIPDYQKANGEGLETLKNFFESKFAA